jgi:tRNA A-37 threonylcarbamoyl transferase component Bud32
LKYIFFPPRGRKEWLIAYQLQKKGLNIPKPLGWMEKVRRGLVKESYYLSEAIGSGISLIEDPVKLGNPSILLEVARTVKKAHHAGLFHRDLHAGNFLCDGQSLYLIDLHNAKIVKTLSLGRRLWNLALLFHSLRYSWMEKYQSLFMDVYFEGESLQLQKKEELLQKIHSWMDHLQKRHWKSRTKRCLKESSEFSVERGRGISYYHRRDFPLNILMEMAKEHRRSKLEKPSDLLKYSPEVTVSILGEWGKRISVKNYHPPKVWDRFKEHFRRSKGMRAWISGNGLRVRGVPTLKPLGLEEKRDWLGLKESLFFMEVLEGTQELDRYILNQLKDFRERRVFIKLFAQWLSQFHHRNLYHRDMKTCNILVSKEGESWHFYLLDLEDVRLDKKVHERDLFENFLQLNTSTPKIMTTTDRFRFFRDYVGFGRIVKNENIFLKRLVEESKRRGLVYNSPQGVLIEKL